MANWELILSDALAGALAGGLALLVTRRAKDPNGRRTTMIRVACVVAGIVAGQQLISPRLKNRQVRHELHAAAMEIYGNEESAALNTQVLMPIMTDPRFEHRINELRTQATTHPSATLKGPSHTGVADMIAAGMARLDSRDQAAIFAVKAELAERSPALCAGFWTGNVSAASLSEGMHALDTSRQRTWITISGRALTKELDANGAPPPAPGPAGQGAMAELVQLLSPDQQAAFAAAAQGPPTPDVACRAFRALAAGLNKMADEKRAAVLRLLNAAATAGP